MTIKITRLLKWSKIASLVIIATLLMALGFLIIKKVRFAAAPTNQPTPNFSNNEPPLEDKDYGLRDPHLNNEQNLIKDYLASRLSELSPIKEVLGGKFYLTAIQFISDTQVLIDYEDGHIALQAEVGYTLNKQELKINSFKITKEN